MSEVYSSDMAEFWNEEGGRKWVNFQEILDSSLSHFGHEAMDIAEIRPGEKVLDIGCGCGDTTLEMAQRVGRNGQVTGVDLSTIILEQAKYKITSMLKPVVNFNCVDAQSHDFTPQTYDLIFSRFGVMFFNDPVAAFHNMRLALKPNGRLVFICWQSLHENQWVSLPLQVAGNYAPLPTPSPPNEPGPFSFGASLRITEILKGAGYKSPSIQQYVTKFNLGRTPEKAAKFISTIGPASFLMDDPDIGYDIKISFMEELCQALALHQTDLGVELDAASWVVSASNF